VEKIKRKKEKKRRETGGKEKRGARGSDALGEIIFQRAA
jgi:hypothetical protein